MLDSIFNPKSIAIVGASRDEKKVGYVVVKNLISAGYKGKIFPINPYADEILGIKCYKFLKDVKDFVELVVICVPALATLEVIKDALSIGVKAAVIITAGFKETGPSGAKLEEEIKNITKNKMRVVGPNCLGVINTDIGLNATFAGETPPKGRISLFSQSGALGVAILDWACGKNIGISKFISLGNKMDINEADCLEYFMEDADTDVVLGYIEDVVCGRRFLEIAKNITKIKPVVLIKAGGSKYGARAASSHTGALAGSDIAFETVCKQTGIIRVKGVEELFNYGIGFVRKKFLEGNRLIIITNAGGPGILAADACENAGFELPILRKEIVEELKKGLPGNASLYNPIDIIGDADSKRYEFVIEKVINEDNIDGIMVLLTPQAMTDVEEVAKIVVNKDKETSKPIICCFMGDLKVKEGFSILQSNNIPSYSCPEIAVSVFEKLWKFNIWKKQKNEEIEQFFDVDKKKAESLMEKFISEKKTQITEYLAMDFLSCYGIKFPKRGFAKTSKEAVKIAEEIGFPVVMKISSDDVLHKTEVGGVKINLNSKKEVEEGFIEITSNVKKVMPNVFINGVGIYEMVKDYKEIIVGVSYDKTFGHMVMVGLGGIYVEVLKDVSFRIIPFSRKEAYNMLAELKTYKLLKGIRGEKPSDIDAIVDILLRISQLVRDFPNIVELDINPLAVLEKGVVGLDARLIISV